MRKIVIVILAFCIFVENIFAFDLWNGLDTNMSRTQLIEKASELIQAYLIEEYEQNWGYDSRDRRPIRENLSILGFNRYGYQYIRPLFNVVYIYSRLPQYHTISFSGGICLYFDYETNSRLQAIKIFYPGIEFDDLLTATRRQFGEVNSTLRGTDIAIYLENNSMVYIWKTTEKWIYLYKDFSLYKNNVGRIPMMVIVDIQAMDEHGRSFRDNENARQAENEARRLEAIDSIRF